ncbi:cytidylyltransferase domain-containing protein [Chloroflexota bacterium]
MKICAIIPARGGSKGVPRKNIRLLAGKPLVAHTIEHALRARQVNRTIVSTDDGEIAKVARQYGAEVVMRPPGLATDTASAESVLLHVLSFLQQTEGYLPSLLVLLQPTSPLRQPDDIDNAIDTLNAAGADSLFSCCRSHNFYWRLEDGQLASANYDYRNRPRRQDFTPEYIENGSIYVTKIEILKQYENRLEGHITFYAMNPLDSLQIDTEEDFLLLEQLVRLRHHRSAIKKLKSVKLLVLDFDGVLTDNRVLVSQDGNESVVCHRGDGLGIERLRQAGIPVVVISKEANPVVSARCRKLDIPCFQNATDKLAVLKQVAKAHNAAFDKVVYVGNDINDIACIEAVGVGVAVADAHPMVTAVANIVTQAAGGCGAVREVADLLLRGVNHG